MYCKTGPASGSGFSHTHAVECVTGEGGIPAHRHMLGSYDTGEPPVQPRYFGVPGGVPGPLTPLSGIGEMAKSPLFLAAMGLAAIVLMRDKKKNPRKGSVEYATKDGLRSLYRRRPESRGIIAREWKVRGYAGHPSS